MWKISLHREKEKSASSLSYPTYRSRKACIAISEGYHRHLRTWFPNDGNRKRTEEGGGLFSKADPFFFFFRRFSPHLFWHAIAPLLKLKPAVIWTYCSIKAEWALSLWGVDSKSQIKISYSFIANQITTVASAGRVSFLASQAYVFGIYSECYKADFLHTVSNMKLHVLWINSISLCKYNKKKK